MLVLSKEQIKTSEQNAVESGVFSYLDLMHKAGTAAAQKIIETIEVKNKTVTVLCGNGNNGGDGFVVARTLFDLGAKVSLMLPLGEPLTESAKYYYQKCANIPVLENLPKKCDIFIDALFGIGLNKPLSQEIVNLLNDVNNFNALRVAIDIPSGIEANNGKILGYTFDADLTVTFIALKPCFLLPPASDYCGTVTVADIGVAPTDFTFETIEEPVFPKRRHNSHKGTFGTAALICGSYGMAGAAIMAAESCLRSGVGIAKCALCEGIYAPFTKSLPEAVCVPLKQEADGTIDSDGFDINEFLTGADSLLFGCGCKNTESTKKILENIVKNSTVPTVIDADGLNALSGRIELLRKGKAPFILTPHPAEMARLIGKTTAFVEENRVEVAKNFARDFGCVLVLKGANTIVATKEGEIFFNTTGNPAMATAGSGDVLAGVIVSLLAQGFDPVNAAKSAVYLHGKAGDKAAALLGERAVIATDIIKAL